MEESKRRDSESNDNESSEEEVIESTEIEDEIGLSLKNFSERHLLKL